MTRGLVEFCISCVVLLLLAIVPARNATVLVSMLIGSLPVFARSTFYLCPFPTFEMLAVGILAVRHVLRQRSSVNNRWRSAIVMNNLSINWDWVLAGTFWLTAFASCLLSEKPQAGFLVLLSGGTIPFVVYFIIKDSMRNVRDWLSFGLGMITLGLITSAVVIAAIVYRFQLNILSSLDADGLAGLYQGQSAAVLFEVPSVDGAIILLTMPFLFHAGFWQSGGGRWLARVGLVGMFAAALFTLKRGIWLATAVQIVLLVFHALKHLAAGRKKSQAYALAVMVILVTLLMMPILNMTLDSRRRNGDLIQSHDDIRPMNYALALQCGTRTVLSGFGLTQYPEVYSLFPQHPASLDDHLWFAHNFFLTLIPEIGFIGALACALLIIKPVAATLLRSHDSESWVCIVAMVGYLINATITGTYLINSYADPEMATMNCPATLTLLALAAALMRVSTINGIQRV